MPFERLEPYAVKVASTVLRRGRSREASSLSDKFVCVKFIKNDKKKENK